MIPAPPAGPLVSMQQFCAENGRAPYDIRSFDMRGPFDPLYSATFFELENLALFNRAAYSVGEGRIARADQLDDDALEIFAGLNPDEESDHAEQYASRLRVSAFNERDVAGATMRYADELCVIAAWAFAEKHLNQTLAELHNLSNAGSAPDHRWNQLKASLLQFGIDAEALSSYADANECRMVNNTIKHSGIISPTLAQTQRFAGVEGQSLAARPLATQAYFFGVSDFIGDLFEQASQHF